MIGTLYYIILTDFSYCIFKAIDFSSRFQTYVFRVIILFLRTVTNGKKVKPNKYIGYQNKKIT